MGTRLRCVSQGRESSLESAQFGHGDFTEALIEGVDLGKADLLHKGVITVSGLDNGNTYTCTVTATNTIGRHPALSARVGAPSASTIRSRLDSGVGCFRHRGN